MQVYTVHKRRVLAVAAFLFLGLFFLSTTPVDQVPDPEGEEGPLQVTRLTRAVHAVWRLSAPSAGRWTRDSKKRHEWQAGDSNRAVHHHQRAADRTERRKPHRDTQSISDEEMEEEEEEDYGEYSADDIVADNYDDNADDQDYDDGRKVFKEGDFDDDLLLQPSSLPPERQNFTWSPRSSFGFHGHNGGPARPQRPPDPRLSAASLFQSGAGTTKFNLPRPLVHKKGRRRHRVTVADRHGTPIVEDYVYWASEVEALTPKGLSDQETGAILHKLRSLRVTEMQSPTWNRCGRPKNQYLVFEDGSRACARYRAPHDYLVQGEVMSFYLSRLLGIPNVPVVALSSVGNGTQWRNPRVNKILQAAGWSPNATVAIIQWIDHLERDRMPNLILQALLNQQVISRRTRELQDLQEERLLEMLQWSDLILFDYITGNYDRVASMQDAADKEKRPSILRETIHNLVKSRSTRGLWLIDNESGLLDSYSLLYSKSGQGGGDQDARFLAFHRAMLRTICVFRRLTADRVAWLCSRQRADRVLVDFVFNQEPLFALMPDLVKSKEFSEHFQRRVCEVDKHVRWCKRHARTL